MLHTRCLKTGWHRKRRRKAKSESSSLSDSRAYIWINVGLVFREDHLSPRVNPTMAENYSHSQRKRIPSKSIHSKHSIHRLPDLDTGSAERLSLMWTVPTPCKHMLLFASVSVISLENFRWTTVIGSYPLRPTEDPVPAIHHITKHHHV